MRNKFNTVDEATNSDWFKDAMKKNNDKKGDRIFFSTKIEDVIYSDFFDESEEMQDIVNRGNDYLSSFGDLCKDIFMSFYSIKLKTTDDEMLSVSAREFNKPILEKMMMQPEYPLIKRVFMLQ